VALDPAEFPAEDPEDLRALGDLDRHELLDGRHVGHVVRDRRQVVPPVGVRDELVVAVGLRDLLHPAVEEADVELGLLDELAPQCEDDAQHAVRRGVGRAHVEDHAVLVVEIQVDLGVEQVRCVGLDGLLVRHFRLPAL